MARHADRANHVTAMVDSVRQALATLTVGRRQFVEMRVAESHRFEHRR